MSILDDILSAVGSNGGSTDWTQKATIGGTGNDKLDSLIMILDAISGKGVQNSQPGRVYTPSDEEAQFPIPRIPTDGRTPPFNPNAPDPRDQQGGIQLPGQPQSTTREGGIGGLGSDNEMKDVITNLLNDNSRQGLLDLVRQNHFVKGMYQTPGMEHAPVHEANTHGGLPVNQDEVLADMNVMYNGMPTGMKGESGFTNASALPGIYANRANQRIQQTADLNKNNQFNVDQTNQGRALAAQGRVAQSQAGLDAIRQQQNVRQNDAALRANMVEGELNRRSSEDINQLNRDTQVGLKLQDLAIKAAEMGDQRYKGITDSLNTWFKDNPEGAADASIIVNRLIAEKGMPKSAGEAQQYVNEAVSMMRDGYKPTSEDIQLAQEKHDEILQMASSSRVQGVLGGMNKQPGQVSTPGGRQVNIAPQSAPKAIGKRNVFQSAGAQNRQFEESQARQLSMMKDQAALQKSLRDLSVTPQGEVMMKQDAEQLAKAEEGAYNMQSQIQSADRILELVNSGLAEPGNLREYVGFVVGGDENAAGRLFASFRDPAQQELAGLLGGMALSVRAALTMPGAMSNADREFLTRIAGTMYNDPTVIAQNALKIKEVINRKISTVRGMRQEFEATGSLGNTRFGGGQQTPQGGFDPSQYKRQPKPTGNTGGASGGW